MKKNLYNTLLLVVLLSVQTKAQMGINTNKPLHIFHVDGKNDNLGSLTPSANQQANDFVITKDGYVSIGTINPNERLYINGKVKLSDIKHSNSRPKKVLTIDDMGNLHFTTIDNISPPIETRIYSIINKKERQRLPIRDVYTNVQFDGIASGVNAEKIKISGNSEELILPPNKTLKITGSLGLIGSKQEPTRNAPAFIISQFDLINTSNNDAKLLVKTVGYTESSTEAQDDGGTSMPIIIVQTGSKGANVVLKVKYNGISTPRNGYFLAGAPGKNTLGSYVFVEEI